MHTTTDMAWIALSVFLIGFIYTGLFVASAALIVKALR
jgi:hypothetical protein